MFAGFRARYKDLRQRAAATWNAGRERYGWLDHLARAWERFSDVKGSRLAAACTYSTFLAIFPLLIVAVSVLGFVLAGNPSLAERATEALADSLPFLDSNEIIDARLSAGIIGLVGVLITGMNWIGVIRGCMQAVWQAENDDEGNIVVEKLSDIVALLGIGVLLFASMATSYGATIAVRWLLETVGTPVTLSTSISIIGTIIAIILNSLFVGVLLGPLPRLTTDWRRLMVPALLGGVGLEVVKRFAGFLFGSTLENPAYAVVVTAVGLLVFLNLVNRLLFFCSAIAATAHPPRVSHFSRVTPESEGVKL